MNGSMKVYTILSEASGCSSEYESSIVYRNRPDLGDNDWDEVHEWHVPEGASALWALYKRTARCCGSGQYFIAVDPNQSKLQIRATKLNLGVVQPEGLPMTDCEWQHYAESGQWPHPYGVMPLEFEDSYEDPRGYAEVEVPPRPMTDEEFLALPVLDLSDLPDDIFSEPYEEVSAA